MMTHFLDMVMLKQVQLDRKWLWIVLYLFVLPLAIGHTLSFKTLYTAEYVENLIG